MRKRFLLILLSLVFLFSSLSHASTLKLKDELGREVTFRFPPGRIVSLATNITEILFDLGLDEEIVDDSLLVFAAAK